MIITLPLPAHKLSPNARPHHMELYRLKKKAKEDAQVQTMVAIQEEGIADQLPWEKATTRATFYFLVKRRRDGDNLNSMLKAHRDGIAAAGVVRDDEDFQNLPPIIEIAKDHPRVEIHITKGHLI